jgi:cytoskeleton protein RodZ
MNFMVESSAGKILSQARLAKRLTIDEASHATKLRPDKIVALENDDFSRFGSLAYGKGFLQIYARYLGVDISDQLRMMEVPQQTVSIAEYQYLNSAPAPEKPSRSRGFPERRDRRQRNERRAPSVLPLVIVLGIGVAGIYGFYKLNAPRLGLDKPTQNALPAPPAAQSTGQPPPAAPESKPAVVAPNLPSSPAPARSADAAFLADTPSEEPGGVNGGAAPDETSGGMNELIVQPLKKTWVRIHKDSPDSPPIFEDYLYPGARPLKLRGARFFVEVRDQSAVQIRKNGHPIAYQSPGISIQ